MSRTPMAPFIGIAAAIAAAAAIAGCLSRVQAGSTPSIALPSAMRAADSRTAGLSSSTARSGALATSSVDAASERACKPLSQRIALGDPPSPITGEEGFGVAITNASRTSCQLEGYPQIRLTDALGRVLPMIFVDGGGYVTTDAPISVPIAPGGHAMVVFAKYRCDSGDVQSAARAEISLPGAGVFVPLQLDPAGPTLAYCGPNDPGDEVDVSPIEGDLASAVFSWPPSPALPPSHP